MHNTQVCSNWKGYNTQVCTNFLNNHFPKFEVAVAV
jgi:hypothetical protein